MLHALEEYEQVTFPGFTGSYYTETQAAAMEANPDTVIAYKPLTCDRMTFTDTDGNTLNWPIINDVSGYRSTQKYSCFAAGDQPFSYMKTQMSQRTGMYSCKGIICRCIRSVFNRSLSVYLLV